MALGLSVDRFSFRFSRTSSPALHEISFRLEPRTILAVLGPTGAGKTTLLHALAGVLGRHYKDGAASGSIAIGDQTFSPAPPDILFPAVGLTMQDPYVQISGMRETVVDEIEFTLENMNVPAHEHETRVQGVLAALGIGYLGNKPWRELSGGELQRVALATILVAQPELLLLDEPFSSLDTQARLALAAIVRAMKGRTTTIVTDYQIDFALTSADNILVLDKGRAVFLGDKGAFIGRLEEFRSILPVADCLTILKTLKPGGVLRDRTAARVAKFLGAT